MSGSPILRAVAGRVGPVNLSHLKPRIRNRLLQPAIIDQQQKPFRVFVQTPGRVDSFHGYVGGKAIRTARVAELREDIERLVKEDQLAQDDSTGQRILALIQQVISVTVCGTPSNCVWAIMRQVHHWPLRPACCHCDLRYRPMHHYHYRSA